MCIQDTSGFIYSLQYTTHLLDWYVCMCLVPSRVASASDVKNDDDDDDDSDSEIIRRLQAAKETELKKSDFGSFCSC